MSVDFSAAKRVSSPSQSVTFALFNSGLTPREVVEATDSFPSDSPFVIVQAVTPSGGDVQNVVVHGEYESFKAADEEFVFATNNRGGDVGRYTVG